MAVAPAGPLRVEPSTQLEFLGPFTHVQSAKINLQNPTRDRVTFKVKTTVPKRYCVRPSCGIVEPDGNVDVFVLLQPFDCDNTERNKHKFMIQSMVLGDSSANIEQLWKEAPADQISDIRLKCVLRLPDELLKIEASELVFEPIPNKSQAHVISAQNLSAVDVYFKVKTNAPRRYVVFPNDGLIKTKETKYIKVSTALDFDANEDSRDKLVIISAVAPDDMPERAEHIWQITDKSKISEKVIHCIVKQAGQAPNLDSSNLEEIIKTLRRENADLKDSEERLRRLAANSSPISGATRPLQPRGGLLQAANIPPIIYLVITFLFALIVGKFVL